NEQLLISWHVDILYDLFKEEDIAIEELKMMQFSHVDSLLRNYKMGVRIRFEHHFINWRNRIGIHLKEIETYRSKNNCRNCQTHKPIQVNDSQESHNNAATPEPMAKKRRTDNNNLTIATNNETLETDDIQTLPTSPQSTKSEENRIKAVANFDDAASPLTPVTVLEEIPVEETANHHTDDEVENDNCTLNTLRDFLSTTLEEESPPPKFPSKATTDKC
ncbi:hypothetical protein DOY81_013972, partial [Sarcophaga bullata]